MAYDDSKDVMIKSFNMDTDGNLLSLKIYSYSGNNPKLQIQRMRIEGGIEKFSKLGRLSLEELKFLRENLDEIIEIIEANKI